MQEFAKSLQTLVKVYSAIYVTFLGVMLLQHTGVLIFH